MGANASQSALPWVQGALYSLLLLHAAAAVQRVDLSLSWPGTNLSALHLERRYLM